MVKKLLSVIFITLLQIPVTISAQETQKIKLEPIVVTATRIATPAEMVGKSVTIITAEQLAQQKAVSLADALQNIPGVRITQQRGPGGFATIRLRGLDAEYTQILINGLPVRDPSDPQGAAVEFMTDILVEDIERIEIVRGASSTLYGSDSIGGTINIITKRGKEMPELWFSFEGGSMSTYQEAAGTSGAVGGFNYSIAGKRIDSDGIGDHDTYSETAVASQIGIAFDQEMLISGQFKYSDSALDLNDTPGIADGVLIKDQDDPDDTKARTLFSGGVILTEQMSPKFDYNVKLGYVNVERELKFGPEGDESGYGSEATYSGNTLNIEAQANYSLNESNLLTVGYEYEKEEFEQNLGDRKETPDASRHAFYGQYSLSALDQKLNIVPGVRYMNHEQVGERIDWEVSASLLLGESGVRIHGHVGTGFRAPSLFELYGTLVFGGVVYELGNEDLDPEESLGWDGGIEFKTFEDQLRFDMTYFRNDFDKIIGLGTPGYENIDGGESQGFEFEASYILANALTLTGSYTYTDTKDADGEKFFGVPEHQLGLSVSYQFQQKFITTLMVTMKGEEDIPLFNTTTFTSERYNNKSYTKVDTVAEYIISERFKVWTRVENAFDEEYTEGGYEAPGRNIYGGIKITL